MGTQEPVLLTPTPPQIPPPGHATQQRKPEYTFGEDEPWVWAKAGDKWVGIGMVPPSHAPITPRSSHQSDADDWSKGFWGDHNAPTSQGNEGAGSHSSHRAHPWS